MRKTIVMLLVVLAAGLGPVEARAGDNVWYSVVVPGWGQVRSGHYGRGSLFLSAELVSLTTLLISDIQYDRAVEQYDDARAAYLNAAYIGDAVAGYNTMNDKWDSAEDLYTIREVALWSAIGVWAVNVVDIILLDKKGEPPLALETRPGGFLVTAKISF
jgi:hypothetical protein